MEPRTVVAGLRNSLRTVSKTRISEPADFLEALERARKIHGRVAIRDNRSHAAVRMLVAALALAVREARRDPEAVNAECIKQGIGATRLEVRVTRLAVARIQSRPGDPAGYGVQDQTPRWASAAAYVAEPPNGDPPPQTLREATRYIDRRGRVRRLSNLYARRGLPETDRTTRQFYDVSTDNSTSEWYTPPHIFDCLECEFDLDPASPGPDVVPWIPAKRHYTSNGLEREWTGFVWMNPPYGRDELYRWTEKFAEDRNGICLVPDRTGAMWWQYLAAEADLLLCLRDRVEFANAHGDVLGAFPIGTHLFAIGEQGVKGLINGYRNGLGVLLEPHRASTETGLTP
jgi:hypothetical protein